MIDEKQYITPPSMNEFLDHMPDCKMGVKIKLLNDLLKYLEDDKNALECRDLSALVEFLLKWMKGSQPKISQNCLQIYGLLMNRLGEDFSIYISIIFPSVVERLSDTKPFLRDEVQILLQLILKNEFMRPQELIDNLSKTCIQHKNANMREEFLIAFQRTLEEYGLVNLSVGSYIPKIVQHLLTDSSHNVRIRTIRILLEVYKHVGERFRYDLKHVHKVPERKLKLLETYFENFNKGTLQESDFSNKKNTINKSTIVKESTMNSTLKTTHVVTKLEKAMNKNKSNKDEIKSKKNHKSLDQSNSSKKHHKKNQNHECEDFTSKRILKKCTTKRGRSASSESSSSDASDDDYALREKSIKVENKTLRSRSSNKQNYVDAFKKEKSKKRSSRRSSISSDSENSDINTDSSESEQKSNKHYQHKKNNKISGRKSSIKIKSKSRRNISSSESVSSTLSTDRAQRKSKKINKKIYKNRSCRRSASTSSISSAASSINSVEVRTTSTKSKHSHSHSKAKDHQRKKIKNDFTTKSSTEISKSRRRSKSCVVSAENSEFEQKPIKNKVSPTYHRSHDYKKGKHQHENPTIIKKHKKANTNEEESVTESSGSDISTDRSYLYRKIRKGIKKSTGSHGKIREHSKSNSKVTRRSQRGKSDDNKIDVIRKRSKPKSKGKEDRKKIQHRNKNDKKEDSYDDNIGSSVEITHKRNSRRETYASTDSYSSQASMVIQLKERTKTLVKNVATESNDEVLSQYEGKPDIRNKNINDVSGKSNKKCREKTTTGKVFNNEENSHAKPQHQLEKEKGSVTSMKPEANKVETIIEEFEKSFAEVEDMSCVGTKELDELYKKILARISDKAGEWDKRTKSIILLRAIMRANKLKQKGKCVEYLRELSTCFKIILKEELRSQVLRETCITIAYMSTLFGFKYQQFCINIMNNLINLVPNAIAVISTHACAALKFIILHVHAPPLISKITFFMKSTRSNEIHSNLTELICLILEVWPRNKIQRYAEAMRELIKTSLQDRDSNTRQRARRAYWLFKNKFKELAGTLQYKLDAHTLRALNHERIAMMKEYTSYSKADSSLPIEEEEIPPSEPYTPHEAIHIRSRTTLELPVQHGQSIETNYVIKSSDIQIPALETNFCYSQDNFENTTEEVSSLNILTRGTLCKYEEQYTAITEMLFERRFKDVISMSAILPEFLDPYYASVIKTISNKSADCKKRRDGLKLIRALVLATATKTQVNLDIKSILIDLHNLLMDLLHKDVPEQLFRESCITIAYIARTLPIEFETLFIGITNRLAYLLQYSSVVMWIFSKITLEYILKYVYSPGIIKIIAIHLRKAKLLRTLLGQFFCYILKNWPIKKMSGYTGYIRDSIYIMLSDDEYMVRECGRRAFAYYYKNFQEKAEKTFSSLNIHKQTILMAGQDNDDKQHNSNLDSARSSDQTKSARL